MESAGCLVSAPSASCGAPLLQTPAATANEAPTQPLIRLVWAELRLGWLRSLISVTSSYVIRIEGRRDLRPLGRTATNTFSGWQMLEPKMGWGWALTTKGWGQLCASGCWLDGSCKVRSLILSEAEAGLRGTWVLGEPTSL